MPYAPEKKRAYDKVYRAANAERKRERDTAYREENREKLREGQRAYRETHREEKRARDLAYHAAHREERRAKQSAYAKAHPEETRLRNAKYGNLWRKNNPGRHCANQSERRAMQLRQRCGCCSKDDLQKIFDITALCGAGAHVDHKIQLSLGGHHCVKNLEALTAEEHIEKSKRDTKERAEVRHRNRLLHSWSRFGAAVDTIQGNIL